MFCFISQLLLSLFSLIPGNAQEHLPDILQLLSHHSRLKGNLLNSVGSGGTSHNLQRLLKVKIKSDVWFLICCVFCVHIGKPSLLFASERQEDTFFQILPSFRTYKNVNLLKSPYLTFFPLIEVLCFSDKFYVRISEFYSCNCLLVFQVVGSGKGPL